MILDLNLALVLHTVLAERSVAGAAKRLHVTSSAVSNALARLRDLVGDPLVVRKGRGIVPTPRAAELAPLLARGLGEIERAFLAVPFDAATCTRSFTLAVADLGQVTWVPRLAAELGRSMPLARMRVIGIDALLALGDLGSPEVDVHVGMAARGPGLHAEPLYEEENVLVVAGKRGRRVLSELRHVQVNLAPSLREADAVAAHFARLGIARDVALTVPTFLAAAEIVAQSDLAAMLPRTFVAAKGAALGLRVLTGVSPQRIPLAMCWHERTHGDPAAAAFRGLVRSTVLRVCTRRPG